MGKGSKKTSVRVRGKSLPVYVFLHKSPTNHKQSVNIFVLSASSKWQWKLLLGHYCGLFLAILLAYWTLVGTWGNVFFPGGREFPHHFSLSFMVSARGKLILGASWSNDVICDIHVMMSWCVRFTPWPTCMSLLENAFSFPHNHCWCRILGLGTSDVLFSAAVFWYF